MRKLSTSTVANFVERRTAYAPSVYEGLRNVDIVNRYERWDYAAKDWTPNRDMKSILSVIAAAVYEGKVHECYGRRAWHYGPRYLTWNRWDADHRAEAGLTDCRFCGADRPLGNAATPRKVTAENVARFVAERARLRHPPTSMSDIHRHFDRHRKTNGTAIWEAVFDAEKLGLVLARTRRDATHRYFPPTTE